MRYDHHNVVSLVGPLHALQAQHQRLAGARGAREVDELLRAVQDLNLVLSQQGAPEAQTRQVNAVRYRASFRGPASTLHRQPGIRAAQSAHRTGHLLAGWLAGWLVGWLGWLVGWLVG